MQGPIAQMDSKLDKIINVPRKKYRTQTTDYEIPPIFNSIPVFGAMA